MATLKKLKIILTHKIMPENFLSCGHVIFFGFENSKPEFSSFLQAHQKMQHFVNFLMTKKHILWASKVAEVIKNSKDHKKGSNLTADLCILYFHETRLKFCDQDISKSAL